MLSSFLARPKRCELLIVKFAVFHVTLMPASRETCPALTGEKKRKASLIERVRIFQILDRMLAFLSALRPRRMEIPRNWVLIDKSVSDRLPTASNSAAHEAPPSLGLF
jgi:hypothetical protein